MVDVSVRDRIMSDMAYHIRLLELDTQYMTLEQIENDSIIKSRNYAPERLNADREWISGVFLSNKIPDDLFPDFWAASVASLLIPDPEKEQYPEPPGFEPFRLKRWLVKQYLADSMRPEPPRKLYV